VRGGKKVASKVRKVTQSVIVNRPTHEVFAYVADLNNLLDWSKSVLAARNNSNDVVTIGATLYNTMQFLGKSLDVTYQVIECEQDHHITLKSTSSIAPCVFYTQFEPVANGSTRVSQEATIQINAEIWDMSEPAIVREAQNQVENDLLTLKDLLETSVPVKGNV
jgi:uncharacterized membrane protein